MEPLDGFSEDELYIQKRKQTFLMRHGEEYTGFTEQLLFNETRILDKKKKKNISMPES